MSKKHVFCTIASANYLARVEVLLASLRTQQPDAECRILVCEGPAQVAALSRETGTDFITPEQVCPHWRHMAFYYDVTEFNTALKPFLIEHLFSLGYESVVYLDPDIEIFATLLPIVTLLETHDLVLTPHISRPLRMDGHNPAIDDIVRAGQFNLGFIGIAAGDETFAALKWWQDVLLEHCIFDARHRFFVDQFWADILPSFIQKFQCLRESGYNMAYWNVFQRELRREDGRWMTDDGPLRFFHFSGLAKDDPSRVSIHQDRVTAPPGTPLHDLLIHYHDRLANTNWNRYDMHPYTFATYADGSVVSAEDRRKFLLLPASERAEFGDPFSRPQALRAICKLDFDDLDPRHLMFGLRYRRWLRQWRQLYREFRATMHKRGVWFTLFASGRFVTRSLVRMFMATRPK